MWAENLLRIQFGITLALVYEVMWVSDPYKAKQFPGVLVVRLWWYFKLMIKR